MSIHYTKTKPWGKSPEQLKNEKRAKATQQTLKNPMFAKACGVAGVEVTKRQASKFNRKMGLAYRMRGKVNN